MLFKDKSAIITGGGQGIGKETCIRFVREGASVLIADINLNTANQVAEEIKNSAGIAAVAQVNVTDKASVKQMVDKCKDEFGKVDILINNAGLARDGLFIRMKEDQWDIVVEVSLKGTFICGQAAAKAMMKTGGKIINTASVAALGNYGQANYSSAKGGIISLTRTMALELARYNINVNCVAPGTVMTPMFVEAVSEELREEYKQQIPLRRFADPQEIAAAHAFLCSDDAAYITGQTIFIDGGISVGL